MPDWSVNEGGATVTRISEGEQLRAERAMTELLQESIADLELALEDRGWDKIGFQAREFTGQARRRACALASVMAISNPLIKRGLMLRKAYVWGQGVSVRVRDDDDKGQRVNDVFQAFWDANLTTFTDSEAQVDLEHQLGTHGEVLLSLPTNAITGEVKVRSLPPDEVDDVITDPEDAATPWFYVRRFTSTDPFTGKTTEHKILYPALGYWPLLREKKIKVNGETFDVRWDAPVRHVKVNRPTNGKRGIGDAYAAIAWARADKEFLEDWAKYMRALSTIVFRIVTKASKVTRTTAAVSQQTVGNPSTAVMDPNSTIEAVPKSGATIDADSHRPLATYVAAALGVPVTMLLSDPGATGARAVAETLDPPTELEAGLRQKLWSAVYRDIGGYVIDQAVRYGKLRGTIRRVGNSLQVELPEGDGRTIETTWPEFDSTPINLLVDAIVKADQQERVPPIIIARLLMQALGVEDIDEILKDLMDDQGDWIPFDVADQDVRDRQAERGGE